MDLANMRKNGVRSIWASCIDCHHHATINVDDQPDHLAVPSFAQRMVCNQCGGRRVHVMPAWHTKPRWKLEVTDVRRARNDWHLCAGTGDHICSDNPWGLCCRKKMAP